MKSTLVLLILSMELMLSFSSQAVTLADADNAEQVARGKKVYNRFCSLCHGRELQGQANWKQRKANGRLPAPPHDASGHTWHHDDQALFDMTKFGIRPAKMPDYQSDMPAWKDTLKDDDIWAVLAYIKSRWPEAQRKVQADINRKAQKFRARKN